MKRSSSLATAVAPSTPGIGNVTTGVLPSQVTDVLPIFEVAFLEQPAGIAEHFQRVDSGARQGCFGCALRAGPETNQALIDLSRIGLAVPSPGTRPAPGLSSSQAYLPLTTSMLEYVRPFGSVHSICVRLPANWYALLMR